MRLWTVTKAKELCSDWSGGNIHVFFRVVHDDMEKCLEHLNDLRLPGERGKAWEKHSLEKIKLRGREIIQSWWVVAVLGRKVVFRVA